FWTLTGGKFSTLIDMPTETD
ncbi:hypothetical protein BMETH_2840261323730, partial [methanotrophic bacterial endosymbiont of Bathymodiolus sp.]